MADLIDIEQFYELMDHEFANIQIRHDKSGYRVDRNGIKLHCKYANLKSVDYFHEINQKINFVEFSDLARQHSVIMDKIVQFKNCNLPKCEITKNIRRLHKEIGSELKTKYLDSITIARKIPQVFVNAPEWLSQGASRYVVVVAPISEAIEESKREDVARVLEKLKDDLTCSIPDDLLLSIKIVSVENFLCSTSDN